MEFKSKYFESSAFVGIALEIQKEDELNVWEKQVLTNKIVNNKIVNMKIDMINKLIEKGDIETPEQAWKFYKSIYWEKREVDSEEYDDWYYAEGDTID